MDEQTAEEILRRARQEIAMRQAADIERSWRGVWRWLLPGLVSAALLAFLAVPAPLPLKLLLAMGGVCALRPTHSFFAGGVQLPIESRMIGIYGGFMLTLLVLLTLRRLGSRRLGSRSVIGVLALFFSSMAFDGINSTLADVGLPHLYECVHSIALQLSPVKQVKKSTRNCTYARRCVCDLPHIWSKSYSGRKRMRT